MTLSIIMPTLGRPTLWASIASVVDQLEDGDRLIVVADALNGDTRAATETVWDFQPASVDYLECAVEGSSFGNGQRDAGLAYVAGATSHVAFLDDDDQWLPNAADLIRWHVGDDMAHAHIFRAEWGPGHHAHGAVLWADREVRESNIATPCVVLPNKPYQARWLDGNGRYYVSDFAWLSSAIGECDGVCWWEDRVAVVRP